MLSLDRQVSAELRAAHQEELARRQAASNALMEWSQNQQLINSINRPTMTTCSNMGVFTTCSSH
jgi:hypothetical protein